MITALLTVVIVLLLIELFTPKKDKLVREALAELASEMNREISYYDFIREVSVRIKDYSKERKGCPVEEQLQSVVNIINKHDRSFLALSRHFKFKIVQETTAMVPAKTEVKVVLEKPEVKVRVRSAKKSIKKRK